jgi:hypothetical protein
MRQSFTPFSGIPALLEMAKPALVAVGDQDVSSHRRFSVRQLPEQNAKDLSPHEQRAAQRAFLVCRQIGRQILAYLSGRKPAMRIAPLP